MAERQDRPEGSGRTKRRGRTFAVTVLVGAIIVAAVLVSGTVSSGSGSPGPPSKAQLRSLPARLAADARQASTVVDGSIAAKLAELQGIPVVVNQWASWCPNCREEFPLFQRLSKEFDGRVAFVGLDSGDKRDDAESFLEKFPVPYPSISDPDAGQASSIGGGAGWPTTMFYDRDGRKTYLREGGYVTAATLRADIESYALNAEG